ncbi:MAG: hypothetical protein JW991_03270 [Candidatus Pacebacteria bacterium]|nr:hypothetical protein [Candidatus Paceibacterota bacterium]
MTIEVLLPRKNLDPFRRESLNDREAGLLKALLAEYGVTSETHSRVVELFAGDAPHALMMANLGRDVRNIVCVDRYLPVEPLVEGVKWRHLDLFQLSEALIFGEPLPQSVINLQYKGDVVIAINEWWRNRETFDNVVDYFCRPGGLAYTLRGVRIRE